MLPGVRRRVSREAVDEASFHACGCGGVALTASRHRALEGARERFGHRDVTSEAPTTNPPKKGRAAVGTAAREELGEDGSIRLSSNRPDFSSPFEGNRPPGRTLFMSKPGVAGSSPCLLSSPPRLHVAAPPAPSRRRDRTRADRRALEARPPPRLTGVTPSPMGRSPADTGSMEGAASQQGSS
jgi:hypothetical protein